MSIRRYGPGKFDTILDSYVYTVSLDGGGDEEAGDVSTTNWYGLLRGNLRESVERIAKEDKDKLTKEEADFLDENSAGAIIEENDQGFVSVEYFGGPKRLEAEWDKIVASVEEMESEAEEGDPDPSYRGLGGKSKKAVSQEIREGKRLQGAELTQADVGRMLDWTLGPVQQIDVGKRVWLKDYGLVMENNEQRDKRKGLAGFGTSDAGQTCVRTASGRVACGTRLSKGARR